MWVRLTNVLLYSFRLRKVRSARSLFLISNARTPRLQSIRTTRGRTPRLKLSAMQARPRAVVPLPLAKMRAGASLLNRRRRGGKASRWLTISWSGPRLHYLCIASDGPLSRVACCFMRTVPRLVCTPRIVKAERGAERCIVPLLLCWTLRKLLVDRVYPRATQGCPPRPNAMKV